MKVLVILALAVGLGGGTILAVALGSIAADADRRAEQTPAGRRSSLRSDQ